MGLLGQFAKSLKLVESTMHLWFYWNGSISCTVPPVSTSFIVCL